MRRRVTGLVAFCLTALMAAAPANGATCGRAAAAKRGTWFSATPPRPGSSLAHSEVGEPYWINVVAIDPGDPRGLFATDGLRIQRSIDGGCTWKQVYELPELPGVAPSRDTGRISSIDVARIGGRTRVLLAVQDVGTPMFMTHAVVVRSDDGYTGWTAVYDPVAFGAAPPTTGWPPIVHSVGQVVYAAVPGVDGAASYARSDDGGRTWAARTPLADRLPREFGIVGFAVNPWRPDELWEWRDRLLRHSTDGAVSWTAVDPYPGYDDNPRWTMADLVWLRRGGPARILIFGEDFDRKTLVTWPVGTWSGDGGRTFRTLVSPGKGLPLSRAVVVHVGTGDAFVLDENRHAWRIPHLGRPPRAGEWRRLPDAPLNPCAPFPWACQPDGTTAVPGIVAMPTGPTVQILAVAR